MTLGFCFCYDDAFCYPFWLLVDNIYWDLLMKNPENKTKTKI